MIVPDSGTARQVKKNSLRRGSQRVTRIRPRLEVERRREDELARVDDAEGPRRAAEINLDRHEKNVLGGVVHVEKQFPADLVAKTFRD